MTTLAELRLANLREQKKSAEPAAAEVAEAVPEPAPVPEPVAAPEPAAVPRPVPPSGGTYLDPAVRGDDLVLSQYLTDSSPAVDEEVEAVDLEAERTAAFFERVQSALSTKTQHPSGAKVTVDMSTALFHRTKRYCLDHGNVTLRQLFLDLMTEFLNEEGY